ncbi:MAG: ATP-binding protein [Nitrospinota bacterium]|nr:ATP-binding protein [Nitrospinota bacterium]
MHKLLEKQIQKYIKDEKSLSHECRSLLKAVNQAYHDFDTNHKILDQAQDVIVHELELQSRQNELLLQSAGDGIIGVDLKGNIIFFNPAARRMLGYTQKELLGRSFHSTILHSYPDGTPYNKKTSPLRKALTNSACYRQSDEVFWRKGLSFFPVDYTCTPILDQQKVKGAMIIFKNISDQIRAQQALQRYTQELKESQKNLEDFTTIASHDLREPLRKIINYGDILEKQMQPHLNEKGKDYLRRMTQASQHLDQLIAHLLEFSKAGIKSLKIEEVNLNSIIVEVNYYLEVLIAKTQAEIKILPESNGFRPIIEADWNQMYQLFQNLISNSIKFQKPGIPPEVNIKLNALDQNFINIHIQDNGIGFDESKTEKIFKPFERLHGKNEYEGTGMGLSICEKIVTRHGGKINVISQPQQGSTFVITLPVKQSARPE